MAFVPEHRNQEATLYVGDLDPKVSEPLLWELFLQAGPVSNVFIPKDKVSGEHQGFGFVEYFSESDADYASKIMNMIKLYNRPLRVNKASRDKKFFDVGANLFIGNLDPEVDEKLLYDTFSAFGVIVQTPKVVRGERCYGFISFDCFEASDAAIAAMNGQYLCNRPIHVSYAIKKDSVRGERHGDMAERALAANRPSGNASRPHTMFAAALPPGMAAPALPPIPGAGPPGFPPAFPPSFPPAPFPSFPPGMPFPPQFMGMPQFQQFPFPPQQPPQSQPPGSFPPPPIALPPGIRPPGMPPMGFPGAPPMGFPGAPSFPPGGPPPSFPPGALPPNFSSGAPPPNFPSGAPPPNFPPGAPPSNFPPTASDPPQPPVGR